MNTQPSEASTPPDAPKEIAQPDLFSERLAAVRTHRNPLLEAARPLLRAQADMPEYLDTDAIPALRSLLEQEMRTFQKLCEQANIRRDHMIGARYCLCTALDEVAMQTTWGQNRESGAAWITNSLATVFHEDRQGGDKIYLLIGRLMNDPDEHLDLLEVIHRVLSFGFEGRYRLETDGHRKHEAVRQRLYDEIMLRREPLQVELSPNWRPDTNGRRVSFYNFPVWITVAVLSAILLAMYGYDKYRLATRAAEVRKQIANIGHMRPSSASQALHLKQLLRDEIAAGIVSVDEDAHHSSVTFQGDAIFPPGGVSGKATMGPLIAKIAGEIAKVPGQVTVTGYTDSIPIRSRQFASNQALSHERSTQVMQMLQAAGIPANRLEAVGKGDADPVGDNKTTDGRSQNRRVEIVVTRQS
ncbi:hypothetical protein WL93_12110 [Burkholderia diffusa]|uniref:type VI secretion system protein TssL, long form n=1 Tax=Burkholderia diffusa TaxID=488732 RepID=UPI00075CC570|nr:type VI secretion system protein TssL, long form [Burkholderia diffusa]KVH46119.1 hypothetical protein WJ39_20450 [Burkholderia diffusa]KWF92708.1 hypothetical protein WL93_12110 [Burkholderia diffusa]